MFIWGLSESLRDLFMKDFYLPESKGIHTVFSLLRFSLLRTTYVVVCKRTLSALFKANILVLLRSCRYGHITIFVELVFLVTRKFEISNGKIMSWPNLKYLFVDLHLEAIWPDQKQTKHWALFLSIAFCELTIESLCDFVYSKYDWLKNCLCSCCIVQLLKICYVYLGFVYQLFSPVFKVNI